MPVIVAGEYGKGRSLAVTTDTLWRWGFVAAARPGDDGRQYTKFWENAMRWLIQDPDLRNLHVDSDAVEYVPGAPVRVTVRLLGRDYQPLPGGAVSLVVKRGADPATAEQVARRQGHGRRGRHRDATSSAASTPGRLPRRGPARRSPAARSTRPTSSSSARAAASSTARSATARRSRRSPKATGGSALGADRRAPDRARRSIRRGSCASTAAPTSSCGAAPAC